MGGRVVRGLRTARVPFGRSIPLCSSGFTSGAHWALFFEGIRSERQLVELASLTLAHRWYLGYHVDEPLPDRSSLVKIRQRLGLPVFRRCFEYVVDLCEEADLIWGTEVLADATRVPGNASTDALVPRLHAVVDDHLVELFDVGMCTGQTINDTTAEPTRWNLLETCRLDPQRPPSGPYRRSSDRKISRTDPDAAAMHLRDGRTVLGYQTHDLIDGGKARSILHAFVTPGDVAENMVVLDQLARTMFRRKLHPRRVIADATDATTTNIRVLEDAGIRAYVPLPQWDKSSTHCKRAAFTYESAQNIYRCPQREPLHLRWTDHKGSSGCTARELRPAMAVRCRCSARRAPRAGCCAVLFTRRILRGCAPLRTRPPLNGQCANAARGSRGCSPRPSNGTAYTGSDCVG
jgi:hypothetical protein